MNSVSLNVLADNIIDLFGTGSLNGRLILLAVHFLICLIFFISSIHKRGFQEGIYRFIVVFFLPVFGFLFFAISALINKSGKNSRENIESYLKSIHNKKYIHHEESLDFDNELNTIPMQDSLAFSDNKTKRAYLIYILKKDFLGHVNSLKKAIKSDDSETSHYAAAAMMEIKKQFENMIQSARENYELDKKNIKNMKEYAEVLKRYLNSKIADKIDSYDYSNRYSTLLENLLKIHKSEEIYFTEKILIDLELQDYKNAYDFCMLYIKCFKDSDAPYILLLKLFYILKDKTAFYKALETLERRSGKNTEKIEDLLQYWKEPEII